MIGIEKFKQYFRDFESEYVVIGGAACELLMNAEELPFRATKDIDMVLIVEALTKEFGERFWSFVLDAGYHYVHKSTGIPHFYRFQEPTSIEYPYMIELFSKKPEWMPFDSACNITPIPIDDDISSLSAILLDDIYYDFLKSGRKVIDGVSVLQADYIIPFKAKAWIDLVERKRNGEAVDSKHIKKHKNDVFRLTALLVPNTKINISNEIKHDLQIFLKAMQEEEINLKQIGIVGTTKQDVINILYQYYMIKENVI